MEWRLALALLFARKIMTLLEKHQSLVQNLALNAWQTPAPALS
ncbi:hypothetical protein [Polyangium jinanense]|nr:hypothetical protein [Polyangium jinanense]